MVIAVRLERTTLALEGRCSIQLSYATLLKDKGHVYHMTRFDQDFCVAWEEFNRSGFGQKPHEVLFIYSLGICKYRRVPIC